MFPPTWLRIGATLIILVGAIIQGYRTGVQAQKRPEWAVWLAYVLLTGGASLFNLRQHVPVWRRGLGIALLVFGAAIQAWRAGRPAEERPKLLVEIGFFCITFANILINWSM